MVFKKKEKLFISEFLVNSTRGTEGFHELIESYEFVAVTDRLRQTCQYILLIRIDFWIPGTVSGCHGSYNLVPG